MTRRDWCRPPFSEIYQISGKLPGGGWLRGPLSVEVFPEQGEYVARGRHTGLTAYGETAVDALYALGQELTDALSRLEAAGDRLTPRLVHQRALLRRIIDLPSDAQQ